jgi:RHS repeat-associated protein
VCRYEYDPYGKIVEQEFNPELKYLFTGQELESEISSTSFWNFRARMFNSEIGLFYAPDPAQQGYSRYGYCLGNPINFVDPTGRYTGSGGLFWTPDMNADQSRWDEDDWEKEAWNRYNALPPSAQRAVNSGSITLNNGGGHFESYWTQMGTIPLLVGIGGGIPYYGPKAPPPDNLFTLVDVPIGEWALRWVPNKPSEINLDLNRLSFILTLARWSIYNDAEGFQYFLGTGKGSQMFYSLMKQANQWSGAIQGLKSLAKKADIIGKYFFYIGAGLTAIDAYGPISAGGQLAYSTFAKAWADVGFSAAAVWGGPLGVLGAASYFVTDRLAGSTIKSWYLSRHPGPGQENR